jgi:hypothetical protein
MAEDYFNIGKFFKIEDDEILCVSNNPFKGTERWGLLLGGEWHLDYTFHLLFGFTQEELTVKTDKELYVLFDKYHVRYIDDNNIMHDGYYFEFID